MAALELAEKLVVQIVAIRQGDNRGIIHRRVEDDLPGVEEHRKAFARSLRVPDHAAAPVAAGPGSLDSRFYRLLDGMILMITAENLDNLAAVCVLLENDKMPQQFEESFLLEDAANQNFQFQDGRFFVILPFDGAPHLEPFPIGRQRTDSGLQAVRNYQDFVEVEERGDFLLVGLQLVPGVPDRGVLIGGIFQFDHAQGQAVEEDDQIGSAVVLAFDDGELIDNQPVVFCRVVEIDQPHPIARNGTVRAAILDFHAIPQHPVKGPIVPHQRRRFQPQHLSQRLLAGFVGNVGIQPVDSIPQPLNQNHIAKRFPLRRRFAGRDFGAVRNRVAQFLEPG